MSYQVDTVEILFKGEHCGYSPLLKKKGEKSKMFLDDDGDVIVFETGNEARIYGVKYCDSLKTN